MKKTPPKKDESTSSLRARARVDSTMAQINDRESQRYKKESIIGSIVKQHARENRRAVRDSKVKIDTNNAIERKTNDVSFRPRFNSTPAISTKTKKSGQGR